MIKTSPEIRIVLEKHDVDEAMEWLFDSVLIANDIETFPSARVISVNGFTGVKDDGSIRTFVFPFYRGRSVNSGIVPSLEYSLPLMRKLNDSGIRFCYQNGAYDLTYLTAYHMPVRNYAYDSMTLFWAQYPELPKDLAFISSIVLDDHVYWKGDGKSLDAMTYWLYNGKDCDRTARIVLSLLQNATTDLRIARNFMDAHIRVQLCLGMSMQGMAMDEAKRENHRLTLEADAKAALERARYALADPDFNPNSAPQKKFLFYKMLGARMRNAKGRFVTKIEDASTGAVPMRAIQHEHPIFKRTVKLIQDCLAPSKQLSNVMNFQRPPSGRFYTNYSGVGTETTRLNSSKTPMNYGTNAQNISKKYRDIFTTDDEDSFLLDIDFSAADDVFVTFESGDEKKIELFRSGKDSHSANATLFFPHWTYDQVVDGKRAKDVRVVHPITGIRQITKKLSHGCNYLMAGMTLLMNAGREAIVGAAKEVGFHDADFWSQEQLIEFCISRELLYRNHYERFQRHGPYSWYTDLQREVSLTGGFTTPFFYYQRFIGSANDHDVQRAVAATAGQAGTAGRVNMAMEELIFGIQRPRFRDAENPTYGDRDCRISEYEHGIAFRLQTHDSFTFHVRRKHSNWEEGVDRIFHCLNRPIVIRNKLTDKLEQFSVGLESEVGMHWGPGLHEVKGNSLEAVKLALH